jgi:D-3-phosphoglycerate dehydrogenase
VSHHVVLIADDLSPATHEALGSDIEIRRCDGTDRRELLNAVSDVDAVLIRSATTIDAEVIDAAKRLRVVARAGAGLDNIDVAAATRAGVMVVNAPTAGAVSAAEYGIGLLLTLARGIPGPGAACANRRCTSGVELAGKTVGVLGLGRVGTLVARRLAAFGVTIVAHDPYVQPGRAAEFDGRLVSFDELLAVSDILTVHLPRTSETIGLLDADALKRLRPSALLVSIGRGRIIDASALAGAIRRGEIAGAALDVDTANPAQLAELAGLDRVILTPGLASSTAEAQRRAGISVARSVRRALAGELVPDAVNVQGGVIAYEVRPGLPLAETLGRFFTALAGGGAIRLDVEVRGELARHDVRVLELAALKGVFADVVEDSVSYVNAPLLAQERGMEVRLSTALESADYRSVVTVRGTMPTGAVVSVAGTLGGPRHVQKIVGVDGFGVDIPVAPHMAFFRYADRPGVIGVIGRILADADINIGGMQVSRASAGGEVLVALDVDTAVPASVVTEIAVAINATSARGVDLRAEVAA